MAVPDLRVAIVGYGLAGRFFHAPLIAATDRLAVASVVTSDPLRRRQVVAEHPHAEVISNLRDLWRSAAPDLLVVAAPNDAHAELAAEAIDRKSVV